VARPATSPTRTPERVQPLGTLVLGLADDDILLAVLPLGRLDGQVAWTAAFYRAGASRFLAVAVAGLLAGGGLAVVVGEHDGEPFIRQVLEPVHDRLHGAALVFLGPMDGPQAVEDDQADALALGLRDNRGGSGFVEPESLTNLEVDGELVGRRREDVHALLNLAQSVLLVDDEDALFSVT